MRGSDTGPGPSVARAGSGGTPARNDVSPRAARYGGRVVLGAASVALLVVSVPVIVRGAPLADDFNNCLAPQERGLLEFLSMSFDRLGLIRPARFIEIVVATDVAARP